MIHYICKYTPIELFAGFGAECIRREPLVSGFELADGASHQNLCAFSRALLEDCLQNGTGELILVNCCDSIRRVYDILQEKGDSPFLYLLDLPRCDTACARKRFALELKRLANAYAAYSGRAFLRRTVSGSLRPSARPARTALSQPARSTCLASLDGGIAELRLPTCAKRHLHGQTQRFSPGRLDAGQPMGGICLRPFGPNALHAHDRSYRTQAPHGKPPPARRDLPHGKIL